MHQLWKLLKLRLLSQNMLHQLRKLPLLRILCQNQLHQHRMAISLNQLHQLRILLSQNQLHKLRMAISSNHLPLRPHIKNQLHQLRIIFSLNHLPLRLHSQKLIKLLVYQILDQSVPLNLVFLQIYLRLVLNNLVFQILTPLTWELKSVWLLKELESHLIWIQPLDQETVPQLNQHPAALFLILVQHSQLSHWCNYTTELWFS